MSVATGHARRTFLGICRLRVVFHHQCITFTVVQPRYSYSGSIQSPFRVSTFHSAVWMCLVFNTEAENHVSSRFSPVGYVPRLHNPGWISSKCSSGRKNGLCHVWQTMCVRHAQEWWEYFSQRQQGCLHCVYYYLLYFARRRWRIQVVCDSPYLSSNGWLWRSSNGKQLLRLSGKT
jgi:hypothetical protein